MVRSTSSGYLLDTHVWVWYASTSDRLPASLRRLIDRSEDRIWLSPISLWEVTLLNERGRFDVRSLDEWFDLALGGVQAREATFTHAVARAAGALTLPHRDPADRLLAATALTYDLTLVTVDENLTRLAWLSTKSK